MEKVERLYAEAMRRLERLRGLPMTERRRRRVARLMGLTRAWRGMLREWKAGEN